MHSSDMDNDGPNSAIEFATLEALPDSVINPAPAELPHEAEPYTYTSYPSVDMLSAPASSEQQLSTPARNGAARSVGSTKPCSVTQQWVSS
jgi:hypothetical protein